MDQFNPYRMISRIECATRMIMQRYHLTTRQANAYLLDTIVALSTHPNITDYDRALAQQMAMALTSYIKQSESLNLSQDQIRESDALGERESIFIFQRYPRQYADKVLALTDFEQERMEYERQQARQRRRNVFIVVGVVVSIIVAIWVYNLPYFAEKRAFAELQEEFDNGQLFQFEIDSYMEEYPDGAHFEDAMIMSVEIKVEDYEFDARIEAIHDYLLKYPEGRKAAEYRKFLDNLWVNGIAQYKASVGESPNGAQTFMINMLEYMHANKLTQAYVVVHPELKIKDFAEYPERTKQLLRYDFQSVFSDPDSKIKSIKSEIDESTVNGWAADIVSIFSSSMQAHFQTKIIDFVQVTPDELPADTNSPIIHLYYTVSNQETIKGIPDIWIYSESRYYSYYKTPKYAFIGIQMSFKAEFLIPGTDRQYTITAKGDPGSTDIEGTTSPYKVMSDRCSQGFHDKVVSDFALTSN